MRILKSRMRTSDVKLAVSLLGIAFLTLSCGTSALELAVRNGDTAAIQNSLASGRADKAEVLYLAAAEGQMDILQSLLAQHANVNVVYNLMHPIDIAAFRSQTNAVEVLLEKGALITAATDHACTALHYAAHGGDISIVRRLIDHGADVNAKAKDLFCMDKAAGIHFGPGLYKPNSRTAGFDLSCYSAAWRNSRCSGIMGDCWRPS